MRLAAKLVAFVILGVIIVVGIDGYFSVERETELFDADMERDALVLGRTLKDLVLDVWQTSGHERALELIKGADAEVGVGVRWVWLSAGRGGSHAPLAAPDKSSLVFGVGHVAGSLYRCLGAFAERHLNLTKLESRPRPGRPWEYVFYADVEAAADRPEMVEALATLSEHATFTRLLGTYASAVRP